MTNVTVRIANELCLLINEDLSREHDFALERVGFVIGKSKVLPDGQELIILTEYITIPDHHYIRDSSVGARIGSEAIRNAMQIAMDMKCSIFHVHKHYGKQTPYFSETDLFELPKVAEAMINANPNNIHGVLLLSDDGVNGIVKMKTSRGEAKLNKLARVGYPMVFNESWYSETRFDEERYSRQSFLGDFSQHILNKVKVGIIGLGGGGSHIIQQLAHLGVQNYVIFDDDTVENSNLNRLIGGTASDALIEKRKTIVAKQLILGIQPNANVEIVNDVWQTSPESLQTCDVAFGAVDLFIGRRDIEIECRRYLIPFIDIGMDVKTVGQEPPRLYGQIILSMPGMHCMECFGYLNEKLLANEAERYGDADDKPQVVWANGVLASNAIGIFVDLVTGWSRAQELICYQEYDGNKVTLSRSYKLDYLNHKSCPHFLLKEAGPINWNGIK